MSDISKAELKKEIQEILKDADLDNTSAKKVRLQLQEKLDCDLTERKKEVDALVMEVIDEQTQDDDEEEEEEEEEEEDQPPPKKKAGPKSRKKAASESGSEYEASGSGSEEEVPSDGGGSDYEPDEPVRVGRGKKKGAPKRRGSDDESSGEEWGAKKGGSKKGRKKKGGSSDDDSDYEKPKAKKRKAGNGTAKGGYTAPVKLSEELADIVGGDEMPRHEVVKRMWAYIKDNKLQDPKNKQMIKCDEKLSKVIPTKKFRGFGMTKFLKDHMNVEGGSKNGARKKKPVDSDVEDSD